MIPELGHLALWLAAAAALLQAVAPGMGLWRNDDSLTGLANRRELGAAMEAALKPKVLETLGAIARDYEQLANMQDQRMSATLNEDNSFSASAESEE